MKRPILTPYGKGEIENVYITDLGHIMIKVWYKKMDLFINWTLKKLIEYNLKKDGNNIKKGNITLY
jgi:hypothetical protein